MTQYWRAWALLVALAAGLALTPTVGRAGNGGAVPAAPSNLMASNVTATTADLTWTDNSGDEQGFEIQQRIADGTFFPLITVSPGRTSTPVTGLVPNTDYTFRIRAVNANGPSEYSEEVSVTTEASGRGSGDLVVTPLRLTFGPLAVGRGRRRLVTIINSGKGPLFGTVIAPDALEPSSGFSIIRGGGPFRLARGLRKIIVVAFRPTEAREHEATLQIVSDDPARRVVDVTLVGEGR
ncbi:MAG TPA: fibronectin type III domain-containing protein [Armatimonadota bacterium]|nr:fibronectin type III domain-containing protein [Armatimonadota bacterium]